MEADGEAARVPAADTSSPRSTTTSRRDVIQQAPDGRAEAVTEGQAEAGVGAGAEVQAEGVPLSLRCELPEEHRPKRQMSDEHREKLREAQRQRWQRWYEAQGRSPPPPRAQKDASSPDGRRRPKSPELRQKMSASRKAMLERLGGFPEAWRKAQSARAAQRRWGLDVRYRMSVSHTGRKRSPEVVQNMAAGQRKRRERERQQRAAARGGAATAPPPQLSEELAREKTVIELSNLRQVVFGWMSEFEAIHGRKPSLPETAEANPAIYKAFVRYVGLREMLRGGGTADGSSSSGSSGGTAGGGGSAAWVQRQEP